MSPAIVQAERGVKTARLPDEQKLVIVFTCHFYRCDQCITLSNIGDFSSHWSSFVSSSSLAVFYSHSCCNLFENTLFCIFYIRFIYFKELIIIAKSNKKTKRKE